MADQSPPKRITRARAAAKTDTGVKNIKVATASSRAAKARAPPAITKRSLRSEDAHEDELSQEPEQIIEPEHHRGRPKKAAHPEPAVEPKMNEVPARPRRGRAPAPEANAEDETTAPAKPHRGRPKKVVADTPAPEPTRSLRGRTVKIEDHVELAPLAAEPAKRTHRARAEEHVEEEPVVTEPVKKTVRGRAATSTKPPVPKATAPKKTVKFEEPDKENIAPPAPNPKGKTKEPGTATGLRAKPIRKPATTTARATRGRGKPTAEDAQIKSSPLSPKKATQVATAKEAVSDDELATTEKTPMRPLMKSPVKAAGSIFNVTAKKLDFSTSLNAQMATASLTQSLGESVMASPARRPPQSPFKDSMKASTQKVTLGGPSQATTSLARNLKESIMASPARRPPQSPFKDSMKASAQKLGPTTLGGSMLGSPFKFSFPSSAANPAVNNSPFKGSLIQAPAKRPASPTKVAENGSPSRSGFSKLAAAATPSISTLKMSRFATPKTALKSVMRNEQMPPPTIQLNMSTGSPRHSTDKLESPSLADFLSVPHQPPSDLSQEDVTEEPLNDEAIMPDHMSEEVETAPATSETVDTVDNPLSFDAPSDETMEIDELALDMALDSKPDAMEEHTSTPSYSPLQSSVGAFGLRNIEDDPFQDSDSEDELASDSYSPAPWTGFRTSSHDFSSTPATPTPFAAMPKTPKTGAAQARSARREKIGFTPLARQLSDWMAASPSPAKSDHESMREVPASPTPGAFTQLVWPEASDSLAQASPSKSTFFDDEMSVRDEVAAGEDTEGSEVDIFEENFEPAVLDEEDFALANEADELSLLEPNEIVAPPAGDMFTVFEPESTPSEASQEYGDENAIPIDPQLLFSAPAPPSTPKYSTPKRVLAERVCHTVSKVPLKPAADDTPMRPSPKKRSASISRLPVQRPTTSLTRNNTVISYSPRKHTPLGTPKKPSPDDFDVQVTPQGVVEVWSTIGTPARTPRRDMNPALLKGVVVYVDVHTSEGADAGSLFTEVLTQMGARCVKSWTWSGNIEDSSKIGITHVVFKDGGKRTMEKVKAAGGVVSCVGVGWVLDCERQNTWVDEASYAIDTDFVPRGGHRRRKSMEPRALANLNGTLILSNTPSRNSNMSPTKEFLNLPETPFTTKKSRRSSVQWIHSPSPADAAEEDTFMLTPVPATPAPEVISAYGEDGLYGMDTPAGQTPYFLHKEQLVQKTAPAGKRFVDLNEEDDSDTIIAGAAFLPEKKDETVMMRLMAARRKSLQWAPKVGSPLARGHKIF